MSAVKAQDRLDKLRSRLKSDKNVSTSTDEFAAKSLSKTIKKDRKLTHNMSEEMMRKIKQVITETQSQTSDVCQTRLPKLPSTTDDLTRRRESQQKKQSAQARLAKVVQRQVADEPSRNSSEAKKPPVLGQISYHKLVKPPEISAETIKCSTTPPKLLDKRVAATLHSNRVPSSTQAHSSGSRQLTSASQSKRTKSAKSVHVERTLFKRRPPHRKDTAAESCLYRSVKLSSDADKAALQPNSGSSRIRQFLSKTCKGVVDALKGSWSTGTELISSSFSQPEKNKQEIRTVVDPVEMMDFETSWPAFETDFSLVQTDLYLVIDTNLVISNLSLIKALKHKRLKGMTPKIIVPWQVLKELDNLKQDKNKVAAVQYQARNGIRFLYEEISQSSSFVFGQPQHVASQVVDDFVVEVADDHLIKCCLLLKRSGVNVLLLTNDKNLVVKSLVSNVPCLRREELSEMSVVKDCTLVRTCFELPPPENLPWNILPIAGAAHRVALLLRDFLSTVLKKLWMNKFHNLWMLRAPEEEPWMLKNLLDIVHDSWSEISSDRKDALETILFLKRFINKLTYEKLLYSDLDQFGRACHRLGICLPLSFGNEGVTFDTSLAFLKCPKDKTPSTDSSFVSSCVLLTVHHFQLFEKNVVQYCYGLSQTISVPFTYLKIAPDYRNISSLVEVSHHLKAVKFIEQALTSILSSSVESITKTCEGVVNLHFHLVSYVGRLTEPHFVIEDVVEFCIDSGIRDSIPTALADLLTISQYLESIGSW